ncbi:MAG: peptidylprolyl isomerase [Nitrosopumilus sp.]
MNRIFLVMVILLILVGVGNQVFAQEINFNQILDPVVILETNLGNITIEFFYSDAPNHVENFIKLSQSGFYDGTIFHRIIPGFMIQGGDPNTINGNPSTWGQGGPTERVDAEFNTIKHNRGIVSMARSADPNSAGSQFFIVHKNSNFLDEEYTVFGRIVTDESFETLDKIIAVQIGVSDRPIDSEQVKITKVTVVNRSDVLDLLELPTPERTQSTVTPSSGNQKFESSELEITFSVPEGWLLQEPNKTQENSPDVIAVGPKIGLINPVISLTVQQTNQKTLDDIIFEKAETLKEAVELGELNIISQEKTTVNGYQAYVTNAEGLFSSNDENFNIKFKEVLIYDNEKFYTFAYSNSIDGFDSQLLRFEETINSFEILSKDSSNNELIEEVGGCLIATATFGSELSQQVQLLREIRDNHLLKTESGTSFMNTFNDFYYSFSPYIADYERENPVFREAVKIAITPMISSLSILNYVEMDSEAEVLGYGISLIILNGMMYVGIPAIIIMRIRK